MAGTYGVGGPLLRSRDLPGRGRGGTGTVLSIGTDAAKVFRSAMDQLEDPEEAGAKKWDIYA